MISLKLDLTQTALGFTALGTFIIAYGFVICEEFTELRKSKPVVFAAGILWLLVAIGAKAANLSDEIQAYARENLLEFAELFIFIFVAMTYVNTIEERRVFMALRNWMVKKQLSYRALFWITGILAFFISPIADNMTTALVLCAIILAVGSEQPRFVTLSCINIVVAANAGGAFSPFGDITTLMVWQKGILPFKSFFQIFIPCVINFVVPAFFIQFGVPKHKPNPTKSNVTIEPGGFFVVFLFLFTILITVLLQQYYHVPTPVGMMTGFGFLQIFGYVLAKRSHYMYVEGTDATIPFDIFKLIRRVEWDTLLFFYGVMLCIGALAAMGYLTLASQTLYHQWGAQLSHIHQQTPANIVIGLLSALVDNIPLMFAVLTMKPAMSEGQWLLVTLTTGVGGSLLSVGSAAGVALMGQSKGAYTFMTHLRWTWAIFLGYAASIVVHLFMNRHLF